MAKILRQSGGMKGSQSGMAALLTLVIITAATLTMSCAAALLGLGELDMGYTSSRGAEAFFTADGCVEEAFRRIQLDRDYAGGAIDAGSGSCLIEIAAAGDKRDIMVTGISGNYRKKIAAGITLDGDSVILDSWREVSL